MSSVWGSDDQAAELTDQVTVDKGEARGGGGGRGVLFLIQAIAQESAWLTVQVTSLFFNTM